jgi:hypothetical protein
MPLLSISSYPGYSAPGREKIAQPTFIGEGVIRRTVPDVKEHFECGREDDAVRPNIWLPDGILSGMRETCLEFFWVRYAKVHLDTSVYCDLPFSCTTRSK